MLRSEPGSFRDRDGCVFYGEHGEVLRGLSPQAWEQWQRVESMPVFQSLMTERRIIPTQRVDRPADCDAEWVAVLQHERIPFVSYPFEWTFGMLKDAALLHLELLTRCLAENLSLKDGTAFNVQFTGTRPIFIDVASLEVLAPDRPWSGYRQFCQTMLFPLMLQAYKHVPFHPWLRGRLDGMTPQECWNLMSFRDFFRRGVRSHVWLHAWLQSSRTIEKSNSAHTLSQSGFHRGLLAANFQNLRHVVEGLEWSESQSVWSEYDQHNTYSAEDRQGKEAFVRRCVASGPWPLTWDIGCNTGTFSRIAAENSQYVVAMDSDHLSVQRLYQSLKKDASAISEKILPLVSNLADQVAGLGWRGRERSSQIDRGRPDLVLSLALIHHLVISCGIRMDDFIEWLWSLGSHLVIEFVDPLDEMAAQLLSRRRGNCPDYTPAHFQSSLLRHFEILDSLVLCRGRRTLYFARPRV